MTKYQSDNSTGPAFVWYSRQTDNNSPAMFALWEQNINHTITMDTYEKSKDNVILLVTEPLGSCVFGGHR